MRAISVLFTFLASGTVVMCSMLKPCILARIKEAVYFRRENVLHLDIFFMIQYIASIPFIPSIFE